MSGHEVPQVKEVDELTLDRAAFSILERYRIIFTRGRIDLWCRDCMRSVDRWGDVTVSDVVLRSAAHSIDIHPGSQGV